MTINVDINADRVSELPLLALAAAAFATGTEAYVFVSQLDRLAADLQTSLASSGMLATAFALTYAVSAPLIAAATTAFDRRSLVVAGLVAIGTLNILASMATSFAILATIRILCGLAAATAGPAGSAAAAALVPAERRGSAMATILAGLTLAFVLGIPVGSVVGAWGGWRATFAFAGAIAFAAALIVALAVPRVPSSRASDLRQLRIARRPDVAAALAMTLIGFAATFCVVAYIGPLAAELVAVRGVGVGGFQMLIGIGSIAGVFVGGRLANQRDTVRAIRWTFVASALALSLYSLGPALGLAPGITLPLLMVAMLGGAAALFVRTPVVQARLVQLDPAQASVLLALNGSMVFAGQGLGAALGAATIALVGVQILGFVGAAVALCGAALTLAAPFLPSRSCPRAEATIAE